MTQQVRLGDIVAALGGQLLGDPDIAIGALAPLETATPQTIAFVANPRYRSQLATTSAGCVIVAPALRDEAARRGAAIVTEDPYLYFARLTQWWATRTRVEPAAGIDRTAHVDATAHVGANVSIGPFVVVEAGASIGAGARLGAHGFIGRDAVVGADSRLAARVTLGERCSIGARCIVHSGVVIGADGFGFAPNQGRWEKIEQLGAVRIGDDVEIGANTCIDRGALDDTVIGNGVKLDNLIQIGHNVRIGDHAAMAGCVGVAGSANVGAGCTIGGGSGIGGHITLVAGVHITAMSTISRSILKPGVYGGAWPFEENASWERNAAVARHLYQLRQRLRALEKALGKEAT